MKVESIFIDEIKVGTRRREEFRNVERLAASIGKYGLLNPITVDASLNLIAGERRLRACRDVLGWTEIPARFYSELSEAERWEIEREENTEREDLTAYELSKDLTQDAEKVVPIISTTNVEKDPRGRKSTHGVPKKDIANALGVSTMTLVNAEQHVAAVESYPPLKDLPTQKDALETAKALDALPPQEREEAVKEITAQPTPQAKQEAARKIAAESKAKQERPLYQQVYEGANRAAKMVSDMNRLGGVCVIAEMEHWEPEQRRVVLDAVKRAAKSLHGFYNELAELNQEMYFDDEQAAADVQYSN